MSATIRVVPPYPPSMKMEDDSKLTPPAIIATGAGQVGIWRYAWTQGGDKIFDWLVLRHVRQWTGSSRRVELHRTPYLSHTSLARDLVLVELLAA